ncbi:DUF6382 domain-containing protein [Anaerocolumna xylanovorans]|uniref:FHA domain-containing protein n=1 Tax=Anaerocolumna xylanovorans DSM 12503 TaxID=1121345 RepID=A0A1M7YML2_9FIRM|nr:DUF6382 domain-containing protein [Anaerocolumna xylanovorans]SHO53854.1 FHA domain-containing protein [Anaerocolumna xylanovorans DSM 12503]
MEEAGIRPEKEYIKDRKSNYLVLKGEGCEKSYKNKMLAQYTIPGLLRTEIRSIDNIELFYYDVTDLKTVENIYKNKIFHFPEVKKLLGGIFQTIDSSMEYFLEQDDFLIYPEYLFLKEGLEDIWLCYFPGYGENIVNQLAVLFEFIMNKADYKEEPLVLLIYALYKESREKNTTLHKLKDILKAYDHDHQEIKVKKISLLQETKSPGNDKAETEVNLPGEYEKQEEVSYYEIQTYIMAGVAAAVGFGVLLILYKNGILSNEMGETDAVKAMAGIAVMVCLVGYVFSKLFDPKMKSTKMVTKLIYEENNPTESKMAYAENKGSGLKNDNKKSAVIEKKTVYEKDEFATQLLEEEDKTEVIYVKPTEPSYYLIAKDKENSADIPIKDFPFYIGKDKNRNQLTLKEGSVSRLHAVLIIREEEVFLTDLGSTNGTFVNGQKVEKNQPVSINNSDELAFSREVYLFKVKEF